MSWRPLGRLLEPLGGHLDGLGRSLDASWSSLGRAWVSLERLMAVRNASRVDFGALGSILEGFGGRV